VTILLVDEPFVKLALAYASGESESKVVLLQDAIYSAPRGEHAQEIYAIQDDASRRGLRDKLHSSVHVISYEKLVEMMEREKVINFL
jgi:sulfur relay protein TusB/DsrH